MAVFSLIVCDECDTSLRVPHAASPRIHARTFAHWGSVIVDRRDLDLCPACLSTRGGQS